MWRITLADRPDAECPHCHEEIAHGDTIAYDEDPVGDELVWHLECLMQVEGDLMAGKADA